MKCLFKSQKSYPILNLKYFEIIENFRKSMQETDQNQLCTIKEKKNKYQDLPTLLINLDRKLKDQGYSNEELEEAKAKYLNKHIKYYNEIFKYFYSYLCYPKNIDQAWFDKKDHHNGEPLYIAANGDIVCYEEYETAKEIIMLLPEETPIKSNTKCKKGKKASTTVGKQVEIDVLTAIMNKRMVRSLILIIIKLLI